MCFNKIEMLQEWYKNWGDEEFRKGYEDWRKTSESLREIISTNLNIEFADLTVDQWIKIFMIIIEVESLASVTKVNPDHIKQILIFIVMYKKIIKRDIIKPRKELWKMIEQRIRNLVFFYENSHPFHKKLYQISDEFPKKEVSITLLDNNELKKMVLGIEMRKIRKN